MEILETSFESLSIEVQVLSVLTVQSASDDINVNSVHYSSKKDDLGVQSGQRLIKRNAKNKKQLHWQLILIRKAKPQFTNKQKEIA